MSRALEIKMPKKTRNSVIFVLIATALIAILVLFFASLSYFRSVEVEDAKSRLSLYDRSLNDTLERFQHLPYVLARYPTVASSQDAVSYQMLNEQLARFSEQAGLEAVYLMDRTGLVLAASNHGAPQTFIGQNYSFRPYFKTALAGERGEFFGIGATTGRPGYFVSEPVYGPRGKITGVIAIKLDVSELQRAWEDGRERVFASNKDGVIVLSSHPGWLYQTLLPLTDQQRADIAQRKQFGRKTLTTFDWTKSGGASVSIGGEEFIYVATDAKRLGWRVHFLLSERRVFERAMLTTVILGVVLSALLAFATFLRSERIKVALMASQADRTQLLAINTELKNAQKELAQTSKLAALGQLSASVTHELGQPISAMRNYLAAAELGGDGKFTKTMGKLNTVVDRMENITKQLRFFAKPGDEKRQSVSFQDIFCGVLVLMEHDIRAANVDLKTDIDDVPILVRGNRLRLEQVLVNLIKNSLAAMEDLETASMSIAIWAEDGQALLSVEDSGTGFGDRKLQRLQEPFHTTRASGDGMGLGLSIASAILKEHDGQLFAQNLKVGGARFQISLPLLSSDEGRKS